MAATDPRTTIRTGVTTNIGNIKKDDGATNSSMLHVWVGGVEGLKELFYDDDYDVVFSYGEPRSRGVREIQDIPVHYLMTYPITVFTADKPLTGVLVCTAAEMQYKCTYALRAAVESFSESAVGATPAYVLTLKSDDASSMRVGGVRFWYTEHRLEYETDYG